MNHHGSSVDVLGREASCDAEVVDRRRHGTLNHVAHILPRIFSIELLVPVVATDGVGVRAGRALVDVNATAVGVGALSLRAPGVQALREQPAEGLRCVVRLDLQGLGDRSLAVRPSCRNEPRNTGHSHAISHTHTHTPRPSRHQMSEANHRRNWDTPRRPWSLTPGKRVERRDMPAIHCGFP